MVKIRLTRIGRHEDPIYRIVVADSHNTKDWILDSSIKSDNTIHQKVKNL